MLITHVNKTNSHNTSCKQKDTDVSRFSKPRTKALHRIGPHNKDVLSILICGLLGTGELIKLKVKFLQV